MANPVSDQNQSAGADGSTGAATSQSARGSGKWLTVVILVLIAAFFFSSVILNRIAMTQA